MPWNLEIHHIDVGQGDSTLIVARDGATTIRSALIDGARLNQATDIHNYITGTAGLGQLNVMVATHYDADHCNGLRGLLNRNVTTYNNVRIFDQGEQGDLSIKRNRDGTYKVNISNRDVDYTRYLQAIASRGARVRVTAQVAKQAYAHLTLAGWHEPDWLLTNGFNAGSREILWYGTGAPVPAGAPTIKCIAVNQYVLQPNGTNVQLGGAGLDPKNEKSLAFCVQFNNFRYYIGGDIETAQEDGNNNNGIMHYLNQGNNNAGRVHAMKCSHHGSGHSSSNAFINRLRPYAAFISCGIDNGFGANPAIGADGPWPNGHPQQRVLQGLENNGSAEAYYMTEDRSSDDFCRRINQNIGNWPQAYTPKCVVAGAWGPANAGWGPAPVAPSPCGGVWPNDGAAPISGNTLLNVSAVQSQGTALPAGQNAQFTASYTNNAGTVLNTNHP